MTPKQAAFVSEYVIDYNGAKAAERAGYSKKTAAVQASKLLKQEKIIEAIKAHQKELIKSKCITEEKVIERLEEILERCMKAVPVMEWDYDNHEYVETGEYQFDSKGALKAIEMLGKHIGMFDKENKGDNTITVVLPDRAKEWVV